LITETIAIVKSARWQDYLALCKPKIVALIVFTAVVGMLLSRPGLAPLDLMLIAALGIWLAASSAAVINQVVDRKIDSEMVRTRSRPLVRGSISSQSAILFAFVLCTASMLLLTFYVNVLTAVLTLLSLVGYGFIYSLYLKRATPQNIVIGGVAGAAPPVLGWTAVSGSLDPQSLLLFLIIFAWTPPHFWSLAIFRRNEYAKANVPMLPITHGVEFTRRYILLYTVVLLLISLLPFITLMTGPVYLFGAVLLGLGFLYHAVRMQFDHSDRLALRTFSYSIVYLAALFSFLILDHYMPLLVARI
jgi:protoheme IX farnesyltransferase